MKDQIRKTCSVQEASKILGIGRNQAYAAAKRGEIYVIHMGNRQLVPLAWLEKKLSGDVAE